MNREEFRDTLLDTLEYCLADDPIIDGRPVTVRTDPDDPFELIVTINHDEHRIVVKPDFEEHTCAGMTAAAQ